jgi:hypothetical protein
VTDVDCNILDIKSTPQGTQFKVAVRGPSTYAVHFRMATAGHHDAQPVRILSTSAGSIEEGEYYEVVDLSAGIHTILVERPAETGIGDRMCIALGARIYNVLDRMVEEVDRWIPDED